MIIPAIQSAPAHNNTLPIRSMILILENLPNAKDQVNFLESFPSAMEVGSAFTPASNADCHIWADEAYIRDNKIMKKVCMNHPSSEVKKALIEAAARHNDSSVILEMKQLFPDLELNGDSAALKEACAQSNIGALRLLILFLPKSYSDNYPYEYEDLMRTMIDDGNYECLQVLLLEPPCSKNSEGTLYTFVQELVKYAACKKNRVALLWLLDQCEMIKLEIWKTDHFKNEALRVFIEDNSYEEVEWFINSVGVDPIDDDGEAISYASLSMIKFLLDIIESPDVRSKILNYSLNYAINTCKNNMDKKLVKYLICRKEIDPSFAAYQGIDIAARKGHCGILKKLLSCGIYDAYGNDYQALILAIERGHVKALDILLKEPSVNPCYMDNRLLNVACYRDCLNQEELILRLLKEPGVQDKIFFEIAFATINGKSQLLEFLVKYCQNELGYVFTDEHLGIMKECFKSKNLSYAQYIEVMLKKSFASREKSN